MKAVTWLLLVAFLLMAGVSNHQAKVIEQQRHTIRQYMGLEPGVDATPQPPKVPKGPEAPKPFNICRARNVESNKKFADASKHFKDQHLGGSIEGV